jgi:hypothetical protein
VDLTWRTLRRVKAGRIDNQIMVMLREACAGALGGEKVLGSRPERERVCDQASKAILVNMLAGLDHPG